MKESVIDRTLKKWTFEGEGNEPTQDQVLDLLDSMPAIYGVPYLPYAEYVQALPSNKRVDAGPDPRNPKARQKLTIPTWTIYFTAPGRVRMLNDIAELNSWSYVETYEPHTSTGVPGLLLPDRMYLRMYIEIFEEGVSKGRRVGTGSVPPPSERKNAAASNPIEKAETAARSRAIAAWGIGVLPGSGISSLEEVQDAQRFQDEHRPGPGDVVESQSAPVSRDEMRDRIIELMLQISDMRHEAETEAAERMRRYLTTKLYVPEAWDPVEEKVLWEKLSPGKLKVMLDQFEQTARMIRGEQAPL